MIENYYNQICAEWGVSPTADVYTGYESAYTQLRALSKEAWTAADDAGKEAIQESAFQIYRGIGIVPITYYSLEGCRQQIKDVADTVKAVKKALWPLVAVQDRRLVAFGFLACKKPPGATTILWD